MLRRSGLLMLYHSFVFSTFLSRPPPPFSILNFVLHLTVFPPTTESFPFVNYISTHLYVLCFLSFFFFFEKIPILSQIFVLPPKTYTVFKQKIETSDIHTYFPDYTGRPGDVQAGCEYFSHRFQALNQNSQKQVYVHLTCATGELLHFFVLAFPQAPCSEAMKGMTKNDRLTKSIPFARFFCRHESNQVRPRCRQRYRHPSQSTRLWSPVTRAWHTPHRRLRQ